jgi:hypothetical protein
MSDLVRRTKNTLVLYGVCSLREGKGGKSAMARAARAMGMATKKVRSRATRSMPMATKKAMATAAREGNGGKRDGDGD